MPPKQQESIEQKQKCAIAMKTVPQELFHAIDCDNFWGFFLQPQPPHTRQKKYELIYGPQTAEFALF